MTERTLSRSSTTRSSRLSRLPSPRRDTATRADRHAHGHCRDDDEQHASRATPEPWLTTSPAAETGDDAVPSSRRLALRHVQADESGDLVQRPQDPPADVADRRRRRTQARERTCPAAERTVAPASTHATIPVATSTAAMVAVTESSQGHSGSRSSAATTSVSARYLQNGDVQPPATTEVATAAACPCSGVAVMPARTSTAHRAPNARAALAKASPGPSSPRPSRVPSSAAAAT